jgi:uncharacterized membrane protein YfcA
MSARKPLWPAALCIAAMFGVFAGVYAAFTKSPQWFWIAYALVTVSAGALLIREARRRARFARRP